MGRVVTMMSELFIVRDEHFGKDVFLAGEYLAKELGYEHSLVAVNSAVFDPELSDKLLTLCNTEISSDGQEMIENKSDKNSKKAVKDYFKHNAKDIDILVVFHLRYLTVRLIKLYKKYNKNGKVYLKFDSQDISCKRNNPLKRVIKKFVYHRSVFRSVNCFSIETEKAYHNALKYGMNGYDIGSRLVYMPNGIVRPITEVKSITDKENMIITVGRIGTYQKNNELLIEALKEIDLKDWKVKIIGPCTEDFKRYFVAAAEEYSEIMQKAELTGAIYDKNKLNNYYNNAKVFIFTSMHESFGLVLTEALNYNNYIITTDVGAGMDVTDNGTLGTVIDINDKNALTEAIRQVIDGNIITQDIINKIDCYKQRFYWETVIKKVAAKLREPGKF